LAEAEQFLPRHPSAEIDGFRARRAIIRDGYEGMLGAPPKARPRPFQIVLETFQAAPQFLQEKAMVVALLRILSEYRIMMAYAPNL
jgi:murein peptide amidase A